MAERKFVPSFAELVDRLIIDQIKEVELPSKQKVIQKEMALLYEDLNSLIAERNIQLSARLIAIFAAIAQLNVKIWTLKDRMSEGDEEYMERLKVAHQLNGVRNQLKNMLLVECGDVDTADERTNFNTDGLEGWDLYVLSAKPGR